MSETNPVRLPLKLFANTFDCTVKPRGFPSKFGSGTLFCP